MSLSRWEAIKANGKWRAWGLQLVRALTKQDLRSRRLLFQAIALAIALNFSMPARAEMKCEVTNVSKVLVAGVISIPKDAPIGLTVSTLPADTFQNNCYFANVNPIATSGTSLIDISTVAALAPGFTDVYQTSIAGLGIRYQFTSSECTPASSTMSNGAMVVQCPFSGPLGGPYIYKDVHVTPSFVVVGSVKAGAATLSSVPIIKLTLETLGIVGLWGKSPLYTGVATGTLSTATCSVQTDALAVALPNITNRALSSGIGATAGRQTFNLSFACASGAQVSIVITDAVTPSNRSNVLTLAPDSTAKGVGVQILKDKEVLVSFGPDAAGPGVTNQWLIGVSPNGTLLLPLSAQYIRTGDVTPGSLRALATFTMSYN
ncbi:fimbrial protein [Caballeronia sp. KNU42]